MADVPYFLTWLNEQQRAAKSIAEYGFSRPYIIGSSRLIFFCLSSYFFKGYLFPSGLWKNSSSTGYGLKHTGDVMQSASITVA